MALLDLPPALMNRRPTFEDVVAYQNKIGEFGCDEVTSLPVIETSDFTSRPPTFERQRPNGVWLEIRTMMLPDGGMVRTYTDITGRKVTEKRIGDAALHDALTGLPNRTLFGRRLDEAVARSASGGPPVAAMFLDLDRFKRVNDTLGHAAGDELLQQVSSRMKAVVRDSDTLARMGGDEFALLMPGIGGPEAAIATAERLLCAVGQPYSLRGGNAHIGVSIGIVRHPAHGGTAAELTRNADLALYRAKASGRNVFCEFEPRLDIQNAGALALEAELEMALQNGEFALDYQPIWDVAAERVTCVEALLRWHHPIRGIIPPVNFIPLAERSGLIIPIGRWVMEAACREALTWEVPVEVAVNVAPAQVRRREIVEDVAAVLEATGLPPERLKLEITESQELEETDSVIATLAALRGLGLRLALDDFGTAHASLSTLRAFPFTDVKIDRSFTQGLLQDSRAQGLLEAILQVCRVLSLDCVAEGVETQAQFDLVSTLGCTHVQGYLIGRPQGADAIRRRLGRPSSLMPDLPARRREPADQT
jgi:diguanylate cyclase (GGDEF)-like protein